MENKNYSYQPKEKSFEYYIQLGYEFASSKKFSEKEMSFLEQISDIDTSIIKIDDILDNEQQRWWKKCIHLIDWIEETIINAKLDEIRWINALVNLIDFKEIFPRFDYEILKTFNTKYMKWIYKGQKIDRELEKSELITEKTFKKYLLMCKEFTWWHIRYWLEIGQLLANEKPDNWLSKIAENMWIIRQIVDDFEDYFKAHHNPFWDIKRWAKRIPEILFTLYWWDRKKVLEYIENKNFDLVIETVLNNRVREKLYELITKYHCESIKIKTSFDIKNILVDYKQILDKKI